MTQPSKRLIVACRLYEHQNRSTGEVILRGRLGGVGLVIKRVTNDPDIAKSLRGATHVLLLGETSLPLHSKEDLQS